MLLLSSGLAGVYLKALGEAETISAKSSRFLSGPSTGAALVVLAGGILLPLATWLYAPLGLRLAEQWWQYPITPTVFSSRYFLCICFGKERRRSLRQSR